jgi:hypothetical protein
MAKIVLTDSNKKQYTAEFNRDVVVSMEDRGITPQAVSETPLKSVPLFFMWAFKKNHPKIKRDETDELWKNLSTEDKEAVLLKLIEFWTETQDTLMSEPEDDTKKVSWEIG